MGDDTTDILKLLVGDVQGHSFALRLFNTFLQPNAYRRKRWQPGWHNQLPNTTNADPEAKQVHGSHWVNGIWQYISGRNQNDLGTALVKLFFLFSDFPVSRKCSVRRTGSNMTD